MVESNVAPAGALVIERHDGDREQLRALFELAEDSPAELGRYLHDGEVLVARDEGEIVGHLQLTTGGASGVCEIKNMAVVPHRQRAGIGARLVDAALTAADHGRSSAAGEDAVHRA